MSFTLASASSMQRVFRDQPFNDPLGTPLELAAAMNSWVSGQIVVIAGEKKLSNVRVDVSDLNSWEVSEDPVRCDDNGNPEHDIVFGPPIPSSACELSKVHYVEIKKPSSGKNSRPGWYPDPLEPMNSESRFEVNPETIQPIWLRLKVPPDTRARNMSLYRRWYRMFRGTVTVHADVENEGTQSQEIDIELRVFKFSLPQRRILRIWTLMDGSWNPFYNWLNEEDVDEIILQAGYTLARFGISPALPQTSGEPRSLDDYEKIYKKLLDFGVSHLQIDEHAWPVIVKNGWEDIVYRYFGSEWSPDKNMEAAQRIRQWLKTTPLSKVQIAGVRPSESINDMVNVWVIPSDDSSNPFREVIGRGDEIQWYSCCRPEGPFANFMLDCPQIDPRILCWQAFQYGISGFYYWRATQCSEGNWAGETPQEKWPNRPWNPATSPVAHAHNDGLLLYPGPDGVAWPSIRLENLRDGADDYDYLCILRDYVAKLRKANFSPELVARAEEALKVNPDVSASKTEYTKNPSIVERERRRIGSYIEEARADLGEIGPIFPSGFSSEE